MQVLHHPAVRETGRSGEGLSGRGSAVTIGAYDGVHLGHRLVIDRVRRAAEEQNLATVVVTFDRHPAAVVRPESAPLVLTDLEQKLDLLATTGVDYALVIRFDPDRSREPAEDFVREVLVGCLDTRAVVVGHDFHFGYRRRGNVALLQSMGAELGFDVTALRLYSVGPGGQPVSSTRIRELLASGKVEEAAALLGRPHQVRGEVVRGVGTDRPPHVPELGVSVPAEIAIPADGDYAGWYLRPDGTRHAAALVTRGAATGGAPGVTRSGEVLVGSYVPGIDADLHDEKARVEFVARLSGALRLDQASTPQAIEEAMVEVRRVLDVQETA